jgi:hypothetical protein
VGLWVVPVYPLCTLADLLVLNSLEFWAGENPMSGERALVDIPKSEVEKLGIDGIEVARIERRSDTHATLHVTFANGDRVRFDVLREAARYSVRYAGVELFSGRVGS